MEVCKKCGSSEFTITQDTEHLRTYYKCSKCGNEWSRAGVNLKGNNTPKPKNPFIIPVLCIIGMVFLFFTGIAAMSTPSTTPSDNSTQRSTAAISSPQEEPPTETEKPETRIASTAKPQNTPESSKETAAPATPTPSPTETAKTESTPTPQPSDTPEAKAQPTSTPDDCGWKEDPSFPDGGYCSYHPEWYTQSSTVDKSYSEPSQGDGTGEFVTYDNPYSGPAPYIGNASKMRFHLAGCASVADMNPNNRVEFYSREEAINLGYVPCKRCNP